MHWLVSFCLKQAATVDCREETPVAQEEAPAPSGPMDVNTAVQMVLKKALAHDGLCRGLHEACRAIEKGNQYARLCVLAEDCNQPDYTKLIEALCHEHNVSLISVPSNKQLGEYAGVRLWERHLPCNVHAFACFITSDCITQAALVAGLSVVVKPWQLTSDASSGS